MGRQRVHGVGGSDHEQARQLRANYARTFNEIREMTLVNRIPTEGAVGRHGPHRGAAAQPSLDAQKEPTTLETGVPFMIQSPTLEQNRPRQTTPHVRPDARPHRGWQAYGTTLQKGHRACEHV
jgi:hypothetical protein